MKTRYYLEREDKVSFSGFKWDYVLLAVDELGKEIVYQLRFSYLRELIEYISHQRDIDICLLSESNIGGSDKYEILKNTHVDITLVNSNRLYYEKDKNIYMGVPKYIRNNTHYILTERLGYTIKVENLELSDVNFIEIKGEI